MACDGYWHSCDAYWFEENAPPTGDADAQPKSFYVDTGTLPLTFDYYIPKGHPCIVVVRTSEEGEYFSERLQQEFLSRACQWVDEHFAANALAARTLKYKDFIKPWLRHA
jgi:hypothetical protein